ncbi:MAG: hypothetical protein E7337_04670 [Clostridiales bacterium]|nr:hypothetical protein [Clostridiales bacterium]
MFIPQKCPGCGDGNSWKEVINPFTTGIPIGKKSRIYFARGLNRNNFRYRCGKCGYEGVYDDKAETIDLKRSRFR